MSDAPTAQTPYDVMRAAGSSRRVSKPHMFGVTARLEARAVADPPARAVAFVQDMRFASPRAREVWRTLATAGADVTVYGRDLPAYVVEGVAGISLDEDDPRVDIWAFLVVWPDGRAAGFAGNDIGHGASTASSTDLDRDFDLAETEDPGIVGRCLSELDRLAP
jgi:hypothetical protein